MKPKVVFFDFFGVICSEISPIWLEKYYDKTTASAIKSSVFPAADKGDLSEDETFAKLHEITGVSIERIKEEWKELTIIDRDLVDLIHEIRTHHKVYLLSNAISSFLRNILNSYDLVQLFDGIYISSEIKLIKPNKDFFEYVLNDLKLSAESSIMIDDNPDNINGALQAGIDGIIYSDCESLKKILKQKNIQY